MSLTHFDKNLVLPTELTLININSTLIKPVLTTIYARPSAQPPIDTSGNFSAHVSWRGGAINVLAISYNSKNHHDLTPNLIFL